MTALRQPSDNCQSTLAQAAAPQPADGRALESRSLRRLTAIYDESVAIAKGEGDVEAIKAAFAAAGLDDGAPYHLSKALMNGYTQVLASPFSTTRPASSPLLTRSSSVMTWQVLAKKYPKMKINSCSPGFIETDL